jgi:hypothetical protein
MALSKAITQSSGYDATYWRLVEVDIDWENGRANVRLKGYKDKQTREDNPQRGVMDQERFTIRGELFDQFFDVPDLTQIPEWDNSTEYATGVLVRDGQRVWKAEENVPAGDPAPGENSSWSVDSDLRLSRELVYEYIKKTVDHFSDAANV